jgi:hypothetical protein
MRNTEHKMMPRYQIMVWNNMKVAGWCSDTNGILCANNRGVVFGILCRGRTEYQSESG